jgi:hypothetical protein
MIVKYVYKKDCLINEVVIIIKSTHCINVIHCRSEIQ